MKVTLAGRTLYADSWDVAWSLTPGVRPDRSQIFVPATRIDEFDPLLGQTVTLRIESPAHGTIEAQNLTVTYRDRIVDGTEQVMVYTLMDCRYLWGVSSDTMVTGRFNHILRLNDVDLAKAGGAPNVAGQNAQVLRGGQARVRRPGGPLADLVLADIVGQHQTLPRFAYRRLTLNPLTNAPWTAYELLLGILNGYSVNLADNNTAHVDGILRPQDGPAETESHLFRGPVDNRYPVNRLTYTRIPAPIVLAELCKLARVRLYVNLQGRVRIIPADLQQEPAPLMPPASRLLEASPRLYMTDNRAWRPTRVRVLFPIERATRFYRQINSTESQQTVAVGPGQRLEKPPLLRPVVRMPFEAEIGGETRGPGEYVLLDDVCTYLRISVEWLEKNAVASPALLEAYAHTTGFASPLQIPGATKQLLSAVVAAHRTLFQVSSDWIEKLIDLRAESLTVIDAVTGKRAFAPVWLDYALLRTVRLDVNPAVESNVNDNVLWENNRYDRAVAGEAKPAADAVPGPFMVTIEDVELGIVSFAPAQDALDRIATLLPGTLTNPNASPVLRVPERNAVVTPGSQFEPTWGCATELTTLSMDPNTVDQYHAVIVAQTELGGSSPALIPQSDVFVQGETARFNADGELINAEAVRVRARAVAQVEYQSWMDRLTGTAVFSGLHASTTPHGHVASITFRKAADGTLTTTVDCREPLEPPQAEHMLLRTETGRALLHQDLKLLPPQA